MDYNHYRYLLGLSGPNGTALGQFPSTVDWAPIEEWGRLGALRRWLDPELAAQATIDIAPVWHETSGAPYVSGVRVTARTDGLPSVSDQIPLRYFKPLAVRASQSLVEQKKLAAGDVFTYSVTAFPNGAEAGGDVGVNDDFEEVSVPLPLKFSSLAEFEESSQSFGEISTDAVPVFVPQRILDEVVTLTEQAKDQEVGAILLGRVHCDREKHQIFVEITEQLPAQHTAAGSAHLSFTADTWTAASAAVTLRRAGEQILGWFHSHPARYWCDKKNCPPETQQRCPLITANFFSASDICVQRAVFVQSQCVALLVTNAPAGMRIAMFGWDRGLVTQRGFHIIQPSGSARTYMPAPTANNTENTKLENHETSCES